MNPVVIIVAVLLILGITPFFILLWGAGKDLRETRQQSKKNEEEIHKMIYGNKED